MEIKKNEELQYLSRHLHTTNWKTKAWNRNFGGDQRDQANAVGANNFHDVLIKVEHLHAWTK